MIPLALVALPVFAVKPTNSLFVVMHSIDRVVADYVCTGQFEVIPDALVFRSIVLSQGSMVWHATGGTAPYRVISDVNADGEECVTVMDADGNTASHCGSIKEVHTRRYVDCGAMIDTSSYIRFAPLRKLEVPQDSVSFGHPVPAPPPAPTPGPKTKGPKTPGWVPPPPTPGPDPKKPDHLQPVSNPDPGVHHLPPPAPPMNTPSGPPIHQRSSPAPGPTSHGTTTTYHVNSSTGGGTMYHNTSHSYSTVTSGGVTRNLPVPH